MKRIYPLIFLFLLLIIPQFPKAATHGGGIKAGMIISNPIVKQDEFDVESFTSFSLGPFYRCSLSRKTALQADLLYSRKGAKSSIEIEYLDLTPFIQYRLKKIDSQFIDLYIGPIFSIRLDSSDEEIIYSSTSYPGIISNLKRYDFGFVVGAKLGIGTLKNEYSIDIRYMSSFMYFNDNSEDVNLKNRTLSIMFEVYFGKG